jgi:hypothetical protein
MQEEFPHPFRVMVKLVAEGVRADMGLMEESFFVFNADIAVLQIGFSHAEGLDLGPLEGYPCLVSLLDKIIKPSFFILTEDFFSHIFVYHFLKD